jgi:hypothetical protein
MRKNTLKNIGDDDSAALVSEQIYTAFWITAACEHQLVAEETSAAAIDA